MSLLRRFALRRVASHDAPDNVAASHLPERERADLDFSLHDSPLPAASRMGLAPKAPQRAEPQTFATATRQSRASAAPPRFALPASQLLPRAETRAHSAQPRAGRTLMTATRVEAARPQRFFAGRAMRSESVSRGERSNALPSTPDPLPALSTPETARRHVARVEPISNVPQPGILHRAFAPFLRAARPFLQSATLPATARPQGRSFFARSHSLALSLPQTRRAVARSESAHAFAPPIQSRPTQRQNVVPQTDAPEPVAPTRVAPTRVAPALSAVPSHTLPSRFSAPTRFDLRRSFDLPRTVAWPTAGYAAKAPPALQRRTSARVATREITSTEMSRRETATGVVSRASLPFQPRAQARTTARLATPSFALLRRVTPPLMGQHDARERDSRLPLPAASPTVKAAQPLSGLSARTVSRAENHAAFKSLATSNAPVFKTVALSPSVRSHLVSRAAKALVPDQKPATPPLPERARPLQRFVQRFARTAGHAESRAPKIDLLTAPQNRFSAVSPTQFGPTQPESARGTSTFIQRSTRPETASTSAHASTQQRDVADAAANTGAPWPRFSARPQTLSHAAFAKVLQTRSAGPQSRAPQGQARHAISPHRALDATLGGVARTLARAFSSQTRGRETFSASETGGGANVSGGAQSGRGDGNEKRVSPVQRWQSAARSQNVPRLWRSIARPAPVTPTGEVRRAATFGRARAGLAPLARLPETPMRASQTRAETSPETRQVAPLQIEAPPQTHEVSRPFLSRFAASRSAANLPAPTTGHAAGDAGNLADNMTPIASGHTEPGHVMRTLKPLASAVLPRKARAEIFGDALQNVPSGVLRSVGGQAASEANAAPERLLRAQTATQPTFLLQRRAVAERPELPMNLPPIITARPESATVQRAPGDAPAATATGEPSAAQSAASGATGNGSGATAAGDVELLAHEVWALLRRRLFAEAERMGHA